MIELKDVMTHFQMWLGEHNIKQEGVRMDITFPDKDTAAMAEVTLVRELRGYIDSFAKYNGYIQGQFQLNGVTFRFDEYERPKWL